MSTISISDRRIGTTMIARIHNVTRQTASRWCAAGLFETATLNALAGMRAWTVELWEVLLFTVPSPGSPLYSRPEPAPVPSLSEAEIRARVRELEV